jgi:hypothetical protein
VQFVTIRLVGVPVRETEYPVVPDIKQSVTLTSCGFPEINKANCDAAEP